MAQPTPALDLVTFQTDLDTARDKHTAVFASQAGDCQGWIPLHAHPEVLQIQRPYHVSAELALFALARADQFLSQFTWQYKVSRAGQIPFHDHDYGIGNGVCRQNDGCAL
jgi:hypothetical protein